VDCYDFGRFDTVDPIANGIVMAYSPLDWMNRIARKWFLDVSPAAPNCSGALSLLGFAIDQKVPCDGTM
jgi:hypothetical protein